MSDSLTPTLAPCTDKEELLQRFGQQRIQSLQVLPSQGKQPSPLSNPVDAGVD